MTPHVSPAAPRLSILVPVLNEEATLVPLYRSLTTTLAGEPYEIIFIDDGSTDRSRAVLAELALADPCVRVISFARNFGKSQALATGFRESRGEIVITLDADLQDDPAEIPKLIAGIDRGYDLVSGWKLHRRDPFDKVMPSRCFNWLTARLTGIRLHDFNCGFKAYRRQVVEQLQIYGELHRFIPALAYWQGFRVAEVPVVHHPRRFGASKFGARRFLAGFFDLFTVLFLTRFRNKPLHLFGSIGGLCLAVGFLINLHLSWLWLSGQPIGTRPLLQLGVLLVVLGIQFGSIGLLAEMITRMAFRTTRGEIWFYRVLESGSGPDLVASPSPDALDPLVDRSVLLEVSGRRDPVFAGDRGGLPLADT
ncbi:MAG TPA: glycosyltransferase family 2 protein [Dehalococcoidia bacterium]|nr:glycosyltransferase family 2 protein [Dehalococcoidia bacterium]